MSNGLWLRLLIVTGIVAIQNPSGEPPGFIPGIFGRSAKCPGCGKKRRATGSNEYYCRRCDRYFTAEESASAD
jgi:hypothetical protein